jgi:hypothetical protein
LIVSTSSQFEPVDISQSDAAVQEFVNKLPDSYWRHAIALRAVEEVEFD